METLKLKVGDLIRGKYNPEWIGLVIKLKPEIKMICMTDPKFYVVGDLLDAYWEILK